jgi:hypothetical protein
VHRRAFLVFADMAKEMVTEAGSEGDAVWRTAMAELDQDRGEIEAEVIADGGVALDFGHEWAAFLVEVKRLCTGREPATV